MAMLSLDFSKSKIALDFSGFDAHVSTNLIKLAFDVLRHGLFLTPKEDVLWERVRNYFSTSPFLMPDGNIYSGRRRDPFGLDVNTNSGFSFKCNNM